MKKIFEGEAVSIAPCNRGFVFAEIQQTEENGISKNILCFNQYNFDTGVTTAITKSAYLSYIFSNHEDFLREEIGDYINIITVFTSTFGTILISPNGVAKVYDYNCKFKWKGSLKYKGYAPADAVIHGDELWCSYPDSNTLIRYNSNSMRQEFKIGSGASAELKQPFGLFVVDNNLVITSQSSGLISLMALDDFTQEILHELDEPVNKYIKVDSNEIVLTKSGIYRI